jgi:predicted nucleic acid-binding protein
MLIYCDSMILMYFFDHTGSFQARASNRLTALAAAGDQIAVSHLVRLECRVKPIMNGDASRLARYDAFFARPDVQILPITPAVFDRATLIRATYKFKLGDSLHLAAAAASSCDRFLTNDTRLSAFTDIPVEVLP